MNSKKLIKGGHTSHLPLHTSNKGITLIALVITILVLLILAGVTISMVLGDDGIIAQATQAKKAQEDAEKEEQNSINTGIAEINKYRFQEIREAGYIISTVEGKVYLTGIAVIDGVIEAPSEVIRKIGESYGYEYIQVNDANTAVATGDILRKTGQEDIVIIVKGEVYGNKFDMADAVAIMNFTLAESNISPTIIQLLAGDANNDGRLTRLEDAEKYVQPWSIDSTNSAEDGLTLEKAQQVTLNKVPEIVKYVEYKEEQIYEIVDEKLGNTYKIEEENDEDGSWKTIEITETITAKELAARIKNILPEDYYVVTIHRQSINKGRKDLATEEEEYTIINDDWIKVTRSETRSETEIYYKSELIYNIIVPKSE